MDNPSGFTIGNQSFNAPPLEPGLYLVSTPIGNLRDITLRALDVLAGCDVVACEDTRTTGTLLNRYGIVRPKLSYTEHNANSRGPELLDKIAAGGSVALVSDAGTPLVSDPGFRLVAEAHSRNLPVIPIPGASAPITALVASGLPNDDFRFMGFLPAKAVAREKQLSTLVGETTTLMFFESPARLLATLKTAVKVFGGDRRAVVGRELTKMYETLHRGALAELVQEFSVLERVRGEIVLLIEGKADAGADEQTVETMLREALTHMKPGQAASEVSGQTGISRQDLYQRALALKDRSQT